MISAVPVRAGQIIRINLTIPNFNKKIFKEDADVFRPERWLDGTVVSSQAAQGVGVYSHLMTFLAG